MYSDMLSLVAVSRLRKENSVEKLIDDKIITESQIKKFKERGIIKISSAGGESYITEIYPLAKVDKVVVNKMAFIGILSAIYILLKLYS